MLNAVTCCGTLCALSLQSIRKVAEASNACLLYLEVLNLNVEVFKGF
jgi:hypothetical protein